MPPLIGAKAAWRRLALLVLVIVTVSVRTDAQSVIDDSSNLFRTGFCDVNVASETLERRQEVEAAIAQASQPIFARKASASISAITVPPLSITIPVNMVVLQPQNAALIETRLPTNAEINAQIDALNTASRNGITIQGSTPSGVASATPFEYKLCRAIQTITNDLWYACSTQSTNDQVSTHQTAALRAALRIGGRRTLNMYIKPVWRCQAGFPSGALDDCPAGFGRWRDGSGLTHAQSLRAGTATFPWNINAAAGQYDSVLVHQETLPGYPNGRWGNADGHPGGTHEVGHWHGLLHTFEEVAGPGLPNTNAGSCLLDAPPTFYGDGCGDTPPMTNPSGGGFDCVPFAACPGAGCPDTCPNTAGNDPNYNHMNYLASHCHREFTDDQATRMEASYNTWRAGNPNNVLNVVEPTANDDSATAFAGVAVSLDVLANDATALVAGDLQVDRITSGPTSGTAVVALDARSILYTPAAGFVGKATLKYRVFDCNGVSNEATVTIDVKASVTCSKVTQRISLPQAGTCEHAAFPASAVTSVGGATYTLKPPGPYAPGVHTVQVIPDNGSPTCEVKLEVVACPPIVCKDVTKQLAYGSCDSIDVPSGELWSGGPPGVIVLDSLAGPFAPGKTTVKLTPAAPKGLAPCDAVVTVVPCQAVCADKTVTTDPGLCVASSVSIIDDKSVGKSALAAPDTTKQTPAAPYALGVTSPVSVVVNYPAGLVSAASDPTCAVTVLDQELPRVAAINACLYPKGGHMYSKRTHCFPVPELATLADNCPNARLDVASCKLVGPALSRHIKNKVVPCSIKPDAQSLCVSLEYLDHKTPRTIRAVVRGTDSSGNTAEAETTVKIHKMKPKSGASKSCKLV